MPVLHHGLGHDPPVTACATPGRVSIHAPARGATRLCSADRAAAPDARFNPRPRTGGDAMHSYDAEPRSTNTFQSTPPHGGRHFFLRSFSIPCFSRFNPRPRTGGDRAETSATWASRAPTFQSTPPHGGRRFANRIGVTQPMGSFQSTPPHGGRPARSNLNRHVVLQTCFNPCPRTGGDSDRCGCARRDGCFDPRPRTGGDVLPRLRAPGVTGFNPRPRTGGDSGLRRALTLNGLYVVSIHAPARGATLQLLTSMANSFRCVSIHAPARGATLLRPPAQFTGVAGVSIHAPARGAT